MITKIFKYAIVGILALFAIGIAFSLIGIVVGLAIKVAVLAAVGYGAYRLLGGGGSKKPPAERELSAEERKWLES